MEFKHTFKIKELLKKYILIYFIILSPLIDLITSIMIKYTSLSITLGMIIRSAFLLLFLFYFIFKYNGRFKKIGLLYLIVATTFFILYLLNNFSFDNPLYILSEIKTFIKVFYYPLFLILILSFFENKQSDLIGNKTFVIAFAIYCLLLVVPIILNTSFSSYSHGKIGEIGLFYSPNELGAILAILFPFVFRFLFFDLKKPYSYLIFAVISYAMLQIGTKVPFLAILLTIIAYIFIFLLKFILNKKYEKEDYISFFKKPLILPIVLCIVILFGIFKISNLNININYHKETLTKKQENHELDKNDYLNLVFSSREKYNATLYKKFQIAETKDQIFGLGYYDHENILGKKYNIIEIDYGDIFYVFGIAGFAIYFFVSIILIIDILRITFKNYKQTILDKQDWHYYISLCLSFGIALFAGHVLTAPAVSFYPAIILVILYAKISNGKGLFIKLASYAQKTFKYLAFIFPIILILIFIAAHFERKENVVKFDIINNKFVESENLKLVDSVKNQSEIGLNLGDTIRKYEFHQKKVYLLINLVERSLPNADNIFFFEVENISNRDIELTVNNFSDIFANKINKNYLFEKDEIIKEFSTVLGYDKLTLPYSYLEFDDKSSVLISKGFKYKDLYSEYSNGEKSEIRKLITEETVINTSNQKIQYQFKLKNGEKYNFYYIVSKEKLLTDQSDINTYINLLNNYRNYSWLTYKGSYHKVPWSIEPFDKDGYARNPGSLLAKDFYLANNQKNNRLFENIYYHTLFSLLCYSPQIKPGVLLTEYTSTWLKKDYDIRAPYVDTRHNDSIARNLLQIGKELDNNLIYSLGFNYAKYLLEKYNEDDLIHLNEGVLFPDYFSSNHIKNTHASLNHQLSIINYLFYVNFLTNDVNYKDVALKILNTISATANDWIKDNKDLWYQINENKEFEGTDYKLLTLEDLTYTQELLLLIGEKKNYGINKLLKSKTKYLKDLGYKIPNNLVNRIEKVLY